MNSPFSVRQRNLGVLDAAYTQEFSRIVAKVLHLFPNRAAAERAVSTRYASLMKYLMEHPDVPLTGSPREFILHHLVDSILPGTYGSSTKAITNRARGARPRMVTRHNPDESEPELEGYPYTVLKPMIANALDKNISVLVRGSPGVGKSSMAQELANEFGLPLIDIRLAQKDPTELGGIYFPIVDKGNDDYGQMRQFPPDWAIQASKKPCFIFLDEINAATSKAQQAAAYQIVLERRVGNVKFHPGTKIMAAGNLATDQAIVTPLSSALNNRFLHFVLVPDLNAWLQWAERLNKENEPNIDPIVTDYLRMIANEDLDKANKALYHNDGRYVAFPSPRSWEVVSKVVRMLGDHAPVQTEKIMIDGAIGPDAAGRFIAYWRFRRIFDPKRIMEEGLPPEAFQSGYSAPPGQLDATQQRFASISGLSDYLFSPSFRPDARQISNLARALLLIGQGGTGPDNREYQAYEEFVAMLLNPLWTSRRQDIIQALCLTPEFKTYAAGIVDFNLRDLQQRAGANPRLPRARRTRPSRR